MESSERAENLESADTAAEFPAAPLNAPGSATIETPVHPEYFWALPAPADEPSDLVASPTEDGSAGGLMNQYPGIAISYDALGSSLGPPAVWLCGGVWLSHLGIPGQWRTPQENHDEAEAAEEAPGDGD